MKKKYFATRRSIQSYIFSPYLSAKRVENVQHLLEESSLDGVVTILGVDSRYNQGCVKFANYLLFGFYNRGPQLINEFGISEEDLEDLVILIRRSSVALYCSSALYEHLLPYVAHWRNLQIHCLSSNNKDEIDEDEREEFKIKSFVTMVEGLQNIGFPCWTSSGIGRSKHTVGEFSLTAIEKWPIVQSYALEGVGKGLFFTMRFSVVGVDDLLTAIYDECDPADLERAVIESYSLLERHWEETLSLVSGSGDREVSQCALLDISAADVEEPLSSYFNHGRLPSANSRNPDVSTDQRAPFVRFGTWTQTLDCEAKLTTLNNSGTNQRSLHMVIQGATPNRPISCCRTYFIDPPDDDGRRSLDLLVKLYQECIGACKAAISHYCSHFDVEVALSVANKILSNACSTTSPKPSFSSNLEIFGNCGRLLACNNGGKLFHLKKCSVSINNIKNSEGDLLGSVCFADTFIESLIPCSDEGSLDEHACLVLTSSIPHVLQWPVEDHEFQFESSSLIKLKNVYICTDVVQLEGEVEFFTDGGLLIRSRHLPSTYIRVSDVKSFHSYHTGLPNAVSILHLDLRPSFQLPPVLMSSNKSTFAIAFYPHTSAWKNFSTTILSHLAEIPEIFTEVPEVAPYLSDCYKVLQRRFMWQAGLLYRGDTNLRSSLLVKSTSSLQPELADFIKHFSISYITSGRRLPQADISCLFDREEDVARPPVAEKPLDQKISITVVCGLPGSGADRICSSLVALHKERVRWVVVKVQSKDGNACAVDTDHLKKQLSDLVMRRRNVRPGIALMKRLRIIVEVIGFYDIRDIISCMTQHIDQIVIGSMTTCIDPHLCYIEHKLLFPNVLQQCASDLVNNIAFTGVHDGLKDENLLSMQALVRNVNANAAFLLAAGGQVTRTGDFDLILNESNFESAEYRAARCLSPVSTIALPPTWPILDEIMVDFSQPLLKGTFCARLRALRNTLLPSPFVGNVYAVKGVLAFSGSSRQIEEFNLCFASKTGSLQLESRMSSGVSPAPPAPPSAKNKPAMKPYCLKFYGVNLSEDKLRDWLKRTGRQAPSKKCLKSRDNLTPAERKKIQIQHQHDPLPDGVFFNGSQYCSLIDNNKTYQHPNLDQFIDEYIRVENEKIEEFNRNIEAQFPPDMFA